MVFILSAARHASLFGEGLYETRPITWDCITAGVWTNHWDSFKLRDDSIRLSSRCASVYWRHQIMFRSWKWPFVGDYLCLTILSELLRTLGFGSRGSDSMLFVAFFESLSFLVPTWILSNCDYSVLFVWKWRCYELHPMQFILLSAV